MKSYEQGNEQPEMTITITRQGIARYAGASGDFTRLHIDEAFAREAGHNSVFAMGMYTGGIAGTMVNRWLGVENVDAFDVRFEDVVYPGDEITYTAEVVDLEGDLVTAEFVATNQDRTNVLSGSVRATVTG